MAIKITGQQIKQGLSKIADFFRKQKTPTPPTPPAPQGWFDKAFTSAGDAVLNVGGKAIVPVGAETADLVARQAMDEGSTKDLVRTALQTIAVGSIIRQSNKALVNRASRKKSAELVNATNPDTNAPYTKDEINEALKGVRQKYDYFITPNKKNVLIPGAVIGTDIAASQLTKDSVSGNNAPKESLYSSEEEKYRTLENIKSNYNKNQQNFTKDVEEAKYNWSRLLEQGEAYSKNKAMRHLLQYQNIATRAVPNGINSLFGIDSNNVLPFAGTKYKKQYDTGDSAFMKFTQSLYQINDAIKNNKVLNLDDDLKFKWKDLSSQEKNMFDKYIKVFAKENPNEAKVLLQNLRNVEFGGISKDNFAKYAKARNITLD